MKDNFLFYALATFVVLVTGTQAAITYKRRRVTSNLVTLIANIVILIVIIQGYFFEWHFLNGIGNTGIKILLVVAICVLLLFCLFYGEITQLIHKRKNKNK